MKTLIVNGRRWFQKTYGNTYNTVEIIVNGESVAQLPKEYGYGEHYLQRAKNWLHENGYLDGIKQPLWIHCEDNNIQFNYFVNDVSRERDL